MDDTQLQPGQSCHWLHTPRGGYGYPYLVPAIVLKVNSSRIGLAVLKKTGEWVPRWVKPERVKGGSR